MTRVKRNAALLALVLACIGAGNFTQGCSPRVSRQFKPNILVLSLCSIRQDHLSPYGYSKNTTPDLDEFAKHAFVFKNAFASLSWVNALTYTEVIPDSFFVMNGYHLPGIYGRFMRIPPEKGLELDYKPGFEYLKQLLLTREHRPFYLEVHAKYQHFPYIDFKNRKIGEGDFLSPKSRALLAKYLADPARYSDKLPLLIVLMRDEALTFSHPLVQKWIQAHSADFDPKRTLRIDEQSICFCERGKKAKAMRMIWYCFRKRTIANSSISTRFSTARSRSGGIAIFRRTRSSSSSGITASPSWITAISLTAIPFTTRCCAFRCS